MQLPERLQGTKLEGPLEKNQFLKPLLNNLIDCLGQYFCWGDNACPGYFGHGEELRHFISALAPLIFRAAGNLSGNTDKMMCAKFVETTLVNECLGDALSASLQLLSLPGLGSLLLPGFWFILLV